MSTVEVDLLQSVSSRIFADLPIACCGSTREGPDNMIGSFMTRVCSGLKVPHTLSQVETKTLLVWENKTTNKAQ